jgi:hypothetical protein
MRMMRRMQRTRRMRRSGLVRPFGGLPAAAVFLFLLAGCAEDFGTPAAPDLRAMAAAGGGAVRSWYDPLELDCGGLHVRTTLPAERARYACHALGALGRRFQADFRMAPRVPGRAGVGKSSGTVYLYAERSAYRAVSDRVGLHGTTGGFFNPATGELHLLWKPIRRTHPALTLLHEGTHRLIHGAWAFPVPPEYRQALGREELVSVPFWLQEGLATVYEAGEVDPGGALRIRRNVPRLRQLRVLIGSGQAPPITEVLSQPFIARHTSADYAVSWGLVHELLHPPDPARRTENRRRLAMYLKECRNGFYENPAAGFARDFGERIRREGAGEVPAAWDARIGRMSLPAFRQLIVGKEETLEDWERAWHARIRSLPLTAR